MDESTVLLNGPDGDRKPDAAKVGEQLPKAMSPRDMYRALGISRQTFYNLERAGELRPFLLPRPLGIKRYSGEKVQAFLNGRKG